MFLDNLWQKQNSSENWEPRKQARVGQIYSLNTLRFRNDQYQKSGLPSDDYVLSYFQHC